MSELLVRRVRPWGAARCDIRIRDGYIVEVGSDLARSGEDESVDGAGSLALPGFVNAHTHLDKTLWGLPWHPHGAGPTVPERIEYERDVRRSLGLSAQTQSEGIAPYLIAQGTTHIRTHCDVEPEAGLDHVRGMLQMRESFRESLAVEIVAFPQRGVMTQPGTLALLDEALRDGADVVGGIDPVGLDHDPAGQLDGIFGLADRHGVGVDIHLHDTGEMGAVSVEMIAARTRALSLEGKVVISHAFCLGGVSLKRQEQLAAIVADAGIAVMTHGPGGGTISPPVRLLHDAGVRVFSGTDGIRDSWGPLNGIDMLERAYLVSYINGFRDDAGLELALHMATYSAAEVVGAKDYGLDVGCAANLVLVDAETLAHAVAAHPPRKLVINKGRIVATGAHTPTP